MGSLIPRIRPCQNVPLFYLLYIISYLAKSSDAQRLAEDVVANFHLGDDDDDDDDEEEEDEEDDQCHLQVKSSHRVGIST